MLFLSYFSGIDGINNSPFFLTLTHFQLSPHLQSFAKQASPPAPSTAQPRNHTKPSAFFQRKTKAKTSPPHPNLGIKTHRNNAASPQQKRLTEAEFFHQKHHLAFLFPFLNYTHITLLFCVFYVFFFYFSPSTCYSARQQAPLHLHT